MIGVLISIFVIYSVANGFYTLAMKNGKTEWIYALLGLVVFFGVQFFAGMLIAIFVDVSFGSYGDTGMVMKYKVLSLVRAHFVLSFYIFI